jgi:hypothetical protein
VAVAAAAAVAVATVTKEFSLLPLAEK